MSVKAKKPEMDPRYSPLHGLVSNKYVRRQTDQVIKNCRALSALDPAVITKIVDNQFAIVRKMRKTTPFLIPIYIAYFIGTTSFGNRSLLIFTLAI